MSTKYPIKPNRKTHKETQKLGVGEKQNRWTRVAIMSPLLVLCITMLKCQLEFRFGVGLRLISGTTTEAATAPPASPKPSRSSPSALEAGSARREPPCLLASAPGGTAFRMSGFGCFFLKLVDVFPGTCPLPSRSGG